MCTVLYSYGYVNYETEEAAKDALYNRLTFPLVLRRHQLVVFYFLDPVSHRRQVGMRLPGKMTIPPTITPKGEHCIWSIYIRVRF